jgi:hypothetical protein
MNFRKRTCRPESAVSRFRRLGFVLSLLSVCACGRATDESDLGISGSTNWLECVDNSDCSGWNHASCSGGYCVSSSGARISVADPEVEPSAPSSSAAMPAKPSALSSSPATPVAPSALSSGVATPGASGQVVVPNTCAAPLFVEDESPVYYATPEANYSRETNLAVQVQAVRSNANLTFDWSELALDYRERPIDSLNEAVKLTLSMRELTPEGLLEELNGAPPEGATLFIVDFPIVRPQTSLDLEDPAYVSGTQLQPGQLMPFFNTDALTGYDPTKHTFSVTLHSSDEPGNVRAISLFKLDAASNEDVVTLKNNSTKLTYTVDLEAKPPLLLPLGEAAKALTVDWSQLATPATRAFVAHYEASLPDIEANFLRWDDLAGEHWEADVSGTSSVRLYELIDVLGDSFPGIDDTGTWVFGLFHEEDLTGLPSYVTVLKGCAL